MTIEVTELDATDDREEWNRYVEQGRRTNPFYRAEAIALQADDTDTTSHLLAGFKGQEPVGLFPIFAYHRGPFTAAFSPAPYSWSIPLGPTMLNVDKLKRRKADRRTRRFLAGCLEWLESELSPLYTKFEVAEFEDLRPFVWNEYDVSPGYTYVVDLEGSAEDLLERFSSDARNNVRNADPDAYVVEEGTGDDVDRIVEQVRARYENQGRAFQLSTSFARSLYESLPAGSLRPYVCRVDGAFVGGILVVESDTTRYRWQGGVKPDADVSLSINDLLDWAVMREGIEAGIERYDLVGAGVPSINRYKAKFDPRLEPHYTITTAAFGLDVVIDGYRKIQ